MEDGASTCPSHHVALDVSRRHAYKLPAVEVTAACAEHTRRRRRIPRLRRAAGMLVIEEILARAAHALNLRHVVRERNFYRDGDETHYVSRSATQGASD